MSLDTMGDVPPLDYVENETDDPEDYTPDTLTQSLIGGSIVFVLFLALYGLGEILQSLSAFWFDK